ncbi:EF-hand domain pair [Popillia japonica]|uniref:EF-hand domain pair n=1 Tax=Popillia japonica TaxID=7064 RepID=A0AAW1IDB3_POPJA
MAVLRKAFQMFDTAKAGQIDTSKISTILNTMGQLFDHGELQKQIIEQDPDKSGKVDFEAFCAIASHFLDEEDDESTTQELKEAFRYFIFAIASHFLDEEDDESTTQELKEAFRLYDREGNGYITTATLKEILAALDDNLTSSDLDGIIAEIDTDGSGTVDFDEFMEMMTGD